MQTWSMTQSQCTKFKRLAKPYASCSATVYSALQRNMASITNQTFFEGQCFASDCLHECCRYSIHTPHLFPISFQIEKQVMYKSHVRAVWRCSPAPAPSPGTSGVRAVFLLGCAAGQHESLHWPHKGIPAALPASCGHRAQAVICGEEILLWQLDVTLFLHCFYIISAFCYNLLASDNSGEEHFQVEVAPWVRTKTEYTQRNQIFLVSCNHLQLSAASVCW